MKTLFLDIDGVLITQRSRMCLESMCGLGLAVLRGLSKGKVQIVIVSQRRLAGYPLMFELFSRAGFPGIASLLAADWATKDLQKGAELTAETLRAAEILLYIRDHGLNESDCLVVDDLLLAHRFHLASVIQPHLDNGLTVEQARDILQWATT